MIQKFLLTLCLIALILTGIVLFLQTVSVGGGFRIWLPDGDSLQVQGRFDIIRIPQFQIKTQPSVIQ